MTTLMMQPFKQMLRLSPAEASFARRGFAETDPAVRARLERVIRTFIGGYALALETPEPARLAERLDAEFDAHHAGFAYEGAGFYLALMDALWPAGPSRLRAFTDGPGRHQDYIATVGAGFALARVPWGRWTLHRTMRRLDPLLAWCVPDGAGFHDGFFHPRRYVEGQGGAPAGWPAWARQLFDSGLGRSLWWSQGADPARLRVAIGGFAEDRRAELWCGVGVALAYAGGIDAEAVAAVADAAGPYRADLASGIPFAAEMRRKGGNPSAWTDGVCRALLGCAPGEAATLVLRERDALLAAEPEHDPRAGGRIYPALRRRLRRRLETPSAPLTV